jgi:hypothetical protein
MRMFKSLLQSLPALVVGGFAIALPALAQTVAMNAGSSSVSLRGTSGGGLRDRSCAEHIAPSPNHVLQLNEDASLKFVLKAQGGQPALLIRSSQGQDVCVPADSYSKGQVVIPGRWAKGTYSIYVGDRTNGQYSYDLSIARR